MGGSDGEMASGKEPLFALGLRWFPSPPFEHNSLRDDNEDLDAEN